jgi:hypothetical protein
MPRRRAGTAVLAKHRSELDFIRDGVWRDQRRDVMRIRPHRFAAFFAMRF